MRTGKRAWWLALLVVLVVTAAACGDDDDDDSTADSGTDTTAADTETTVAGDTETTVAGTETTVAGETEDTGGDASGGDDIYAIVANDPLLGGEGTGLTRGVSDDSVTIGCVWQASAYAGAEDAVRARFQRANDEGGVNGRQIELLPCEDDAIDVSQNLQIIRRQVEQEEVFGMLTMTAQVGTASGDYMTENEVPYTGWGFLPPFCGQRWGFGLNGCLVGGGLPEAVPHPVVQSNFALAIIAGADLEAEGLRVALQAGDEPGARSAQEDFRAAFEDVGSELVYAEANMPVSGVTDYTPFVQAALETDPDLVIVSVAFENVGGFSAALAAAGYDGVVMNFVAYIPGLLGASPQLAAAVEGSYINSQIVPQEEQTEYIIQLEDDLEAFGAENGRFMTFGAALAYVQADLWVQMLEAAGEDLNTQTFDEVINGGGFTYTPLDGGPGSMRYPENHFLPTNCAAIVQVVEAAYVPREPFSCYPPLVVE